MAQNLPVSRGRDCSTSRGDREKRASGLVPLFIRAWAEVGRSTRCRGFLFGVGMLPMYEPFWMMAEALDFAIGFHGSTNAMPTVGVDRFEEDRAARHMVSHRWR